MLCQIVHHVRNTMLEKHDNEIMLRRLCWRLGTPCWGHHVQNTPRIHMVTSSLSVSGRNPSSNDVKLAVGVMGVTDMNPVYGRDRHEPRVLRSLVSRFVHLQPCCPEVNGSRRSHQQTTRPCAGHVTRRPPLSRLVLVTT